jgi:ParB-like chromosome segregation protein Spo0J
MRNHPIEYDRNYLSTIEATESGNYAAVPGPGSSRNRPAAMPVMVSVTSLRPADSPRLSGEDPDHVRRLAEADTDLPPILVHRPTMRVIDGMHRLRVAMLRGKPEVAVDYFDGTEIDAFIRAVQLNVTHGLPLTHADREAAAVRIIESHAYWSDRVIAEVAGLSAPTISAIRSRSTESSLQLNARVGRDGRVRPLNSAEGRRKASVVIAGRPSLTLREIAKEAGISIGTARDVRERVRRGEDPVPGRYSRGPRGAGQPSPQRPPGREPASSKYTIDDSYVSALQTLQKDPSLRFTNNGRFLLRWLGMHTMSGDHRTEFARSLPEHCRGKIAHMARCCSEWWKQFADDIEERPDDAGGS